MLDIQDILKKLPHRYPFLLVDRILEVEPGVSVTGLKNVTINEPYFVGHFPDEPIVPGTMILETMAQVGGFIFELDGYRGYVIGIKNAKFLRKVVPGDQMTVHMTVTQKFGGMCSASGTVTVGRTKVAAAEITYNFVKISE